MSTHTADPSQPPVLAISLDAATVEALADAVASRIADRLLLQSEGEPAWLNVHAAADYLGLSVDGVHRLAASGRLPCPAQDGPGGRLWWTRDELDAYRLGQSR